MKSTILTVVITLALLITGFYIYIYSGAYDISQLTPHNNLTRSVIRITKHNSIESRMKDIVVPANLKDTAMISLGFKLYNHMCTECHGGPGVRAGEMAEGLYPKPPEIYKHAREEEAQEFFWIIKNGIKMTSMPAYGPTHKDELIWAMTAFITQQLPKMNPQQYSEWTKKYSEEHEADEAGVEK